MLLFSFRFQFLTFILINILLSAHSWKLGTRACVTHVYQAAEPVASVPICIFAVPSTVTEYSAFPPLLSQTVPTPYECSAIVGQPIPLRDGYSWHIPVIFPCEGYYTFSVSDEGSDDAHIFSVGVSGFFLSGMADHLFPPIDTPPNPDEFFQIFGVVDVSPVMFGLFRQSGALFALRASELTGHDTRFGSPIYQPAPADVTLRRISPVVTGELMSVHAVPGHFIAVTTDGIWDAALPGTPYADATDIVQWKQIEFAVPAFRPAFTPTEPAKIANYTPPSRTQSTIITVTGKERYTTTDPNTGAQTENTRPVVFGVFLTSGTGSGHTIEAYCPTVNGARLFVNGQVRTANGVIQPARYSDHPLMPALRVGLEYMGRQWTPAWAPPIATAQLIIRGLNLCASRDQLSTGPACVYLRQSGDPVELQKSLDKAEINSAYFSAVTQSFLVNVSITLPGETDPIGLLLKSSVTTSLFSTIFVNSERSQGCGGTNLFSTFYPPDLLPPPVHFVDENNLITWVNNARSILTWSEALRSTDTFAPVAAGTKYATMISGIPYTEADALELGTFKVYVMPRIGDVVIHSSTAVLTSDNFIRWSVTFADPAANITSLVGTAMTDMIIIKNHDRYMIGRTGVGYFVPALVNQTEGYPICAGANCAMLTRAGNNKETIHVALNIFANTALAGVIDDAVDCDIGMSSMHLNDIVTADYRLFNEPATFMPHSLFLANSHAIELEVSSQVGTESLSDIINAPISEKARLTNISPYFTMSRPLVVETTFVSNSVYGADVTGVPVNVAEIDFIGNTNIKTIIDRECACGAITNPDELADLYPSETDAAFAVPLSITMFRNGAGDSSSCATANTRPGPSVGANVVFMVYVGCTSGHRLVFDEEKGGIRRPPAPPWVTNAREKAPRNWVPVMLQNTDRLHSDAHINEQNLKTQTDTSQNTMENGLTQVYSTLEAYAGVDTVDHSQWFTGDEIDIYRSYYHQSSRVESLLVLRTVDDFSRAAPVPLSSKVPLVMRIEAFGVSPTSMRTLTEEQIKALSFGKGAAVHATYTSPEQAAEAAKLGKDLGATIVYSDATHLTWHCGAMSQCHGIHTFRTADWQVPKPVIYFKVVLAPANIDNNECASPFEFVMCVSANSFSSINVIIIVVSVAAGSALLVFAAFGFRNLSLSRRRRAITSMQQASFAHRNGTPTPETYSGVGSDAVLPANLIPSRVR